MAAEATVVLPPLHPAQRAVAGDWARYKVVVAGRRFGKTRLAATMAVARALMGGRVWWVGPTYDLARAGWEVVVSLAVQVPGSEIRLADRAVRFPSRGEVWVRSADNPQRLRAYGLDMVVLDEAAFMRREVWYDVLRPALADRRGGALFISTPFGKNWFADLVAQAEQLPGWRVWRFTSADNPYLPREELEEMERTMPPRVFRQEILAEFVAGHEGALWRWEWLDRPDFRQASPPEDLVRVVVAVDPAGSREGAETGIVVAGIDRAGLYWVLGDYSLRGSPEEWRARVVWAYHHHRADAVVVERNMGGDMVAAVMRAGGEPLPLREVVATRGKAVRAEPVAALYERGMVRHVGVFRELEAQLTGWSPQDPVSPDRLDALVWAMTDLMERGRGRLPVKARTA